MLFGRLGVGDVSTSKKTYVSFRTSRTSRTDGTNLFHSFDAWRMSKVTLKITKKKNKTKREMKNDKSSR